VLFYLEPVCEDLSVSVRFSGIAARGLEIELYESEQKFVVSFGNFQFCHLEELLAFCPQSAHSLFEQLYCRGEQLSLQCGTNEKTVVSLPLGCLASVE
jgi:hypothetical protein